MYSSKNEYDRGVNTFSPEGRLFQVEYALEAVKLGSTTIGVACSAGVVICTEKRIRNRLLIGDKGDMVKILEVDRHCVVSAAGVIADSRLLIDKARVEAANHQFTFDEPIGIKSCVNGVGRLMLDFSGVWSAEDRKQQKKMVSRPFGAELMVAGVDRMGPQLWCVDPSGSCTAYAATAFGSGYEGADSFLQEKYRPDMEFHEAEELAVETLRLVTEEKVTNVNIEVVCVRSDGTLKFYGPEDIDELLARLPPVGAAERLLAETTAS